MNKLPNPPNPPNIELLLILENGLLPNPPNPPNGLLLAIEIDVGTLAGAVGVGAAGGATDTGGVNLVGVVAAIGTVGKAGTPRDGVTPVTPVGPGGGGGGGGGVGAAIPNTPLYVAVACVFTELFVPVNGTFSNIQVAVAFDNKYESSNNGVLKYPFDL